MTRFLADTNSRTVIAVPDDYTVIDYTGGLVPNDPIEVQLGRDVKLEEKEKEPEDEPKKKVGKPLVERNIQEKSEGGPTARVESLLAQGKTEEEIMEALEIKRPALLYHFRKLGVDLKLLKKKGTLTPPPGQIVPEGGGDPYFPIKDSATIRKIWECVDEGLRTAEQINTRTGLRKEAIKDVLMKPRPSF